MQQASTAASGFSSAWVMAGASEPPSFGNGLQNVTSKLFRELIDVTTDIEVQYVSSYVIPPHFASPDFLCRSSTAFISASITTCRTMQNFLAIVEIFTCHIILGMHYTLFSFHSIMLIGIRMAYLSKEGYGRGIK